MRTRSCFAATLTACLTPAACGGPAPDASPAADAPPDALDHEVIASVLLERLALEPGERVLLVGAPGRFDAAIEAVRGGVTQAGAVDLGAWSVDGTAPTAWATEFTNGLAGLTNESLITRLLDVHVGIMMPGAVPEHPVYAALQEVLRRGRGRTVHFHWTGAYALDGTVLEIDPEIDAFYQHVLRATDHVALAEAQGRFEAALRGGLVQVTTPAGTDLTFRVGDRPVTRQDGDASAARAATARNLIDREVELPAGAIRVAPMEESVDGRIAFPPGVWNGERVEGLVLELQGGTVRDAQATLGLDAALAEMDGAGPAGRAFREFALGFNPLLAIPEEGDPWIPYYGYGAGVVRLSLGDNSELGGAVGGGYVRWNFFTDATVLVDGETWVEDGRLIR